MTSPLPPFVREVLLVATAACTAVSGCSRKIEEPPPRYERRTDGCEDWCEVAMDKECGAGNEHFEDFAACVDHCKGPESLNWGLQEDGTDACFEEQVAFFGCLVDLECDQRREFFESPSTEHPCQPVLDVVFECNVANEPE